MTDIDTPLASPSRSGMVSVVGRANVGKSTLINCLLGEKVSIVSPVAQTTRNLIRGVLTEPRGQVVFLDTPGVHKAESDLGRIMNRVARRSVEGVDIVLLVLDASVRPRMEDEGWMRRLRKEEVPVVAALNKSDCERDFSQAYRELWANCTEEEGAPATEPTWMSISALNGVGTDEMLNHLLSQMPEGPLLFPADVLSDFPRMLAVADCIREKYFQVLEKELPHSIGIWVETIHESDDGWLVDAVVYVQRPSQKGIVIGAKGRLLRRVKRASERELAEIYEHPVKVNLWVKVEKNWTKNFWLLKKLGYEG